MTAARLTEKHGFASPLDACLHRQDSTVIKRGRQLSTAPRDGGSCLKRPAQIHLRKFSN
jgi:hypothetical protein